MRGNPPFPPLARHLLRAELTRSLHVSPYFLHFRPLRGRRRITAGLQLDGSMTIEDADGDIAGASGEVKSAPVVYTIPSLPVPVAGEYTVSVQARDHAGNQSAKAVVKLTAQ